MKKLLFLAFETFFLTIITVPTGFGQPGHIHIIAGNCCDSAGFSGDGGQATAAKMAKPAKICIDALGNLFFMDVTNRRIRKIDTSGIITTVAGGGSFSFVDNTPATAASLHIANGAADIGAIATDAADNLYFTDSTRIRKVDMATGIITTVVDSGWLNVPAGLCFDASGNMYISDQNIRVIVKRTPSGVITIFAGGGTSSYTFSGDGGPATAATFAAPNGMCFDRSGNMYVTDVFNNRIRKITPAGIISTFAGNGSLGCSGDGGQATDANLNQTTDIKIDSLGNLYVASGSVRIISPSGIITTFAGCGTACYAGGRRCHPLRDNPLADSVSDLSGMDVAIDRYNNVYITDGLYNNISKVDAALATTTSVPAGVVAQAVIDIHPNPATTELDIVTPVGAFQGYSIINNIGIAVISGAVSGCNMTVNIQALPRGVYYIRLSGDSASEVRKMVKM